MTDAFIQYQCAGSNLHWAKLIGARHTCVVSGFERANTALYNEFGVKRYLTDPYVPLSQLPKLDGELLNGFEQILILESAILRRDPTFIKDVVDKRKFARIDGTPAISKLTLSYVQGTVRELQRRLDSTIASKMNYTSTLSEMSVRRMYCMLGRTFAFVENADALQNLPIEKNVRRLIGCRRFLEGDGFTLVKGDSYSRTLHKGLSLSPICVVL